MAVVSRLAYWRNKVADKEVICIFSNKTSGIKLQDVIVLNVKEPLTLTTFVKQMKTALKGNVFLETLFYLKKKQNSCF